MPGLAAGATTARVAFVLVDAKPLGIGSPVVRGTTAGETLQALHSSG